MINVKEAVAQAKQYLVDLFGEEQLYDLNLEEAELSEDDRYWFITLSFTRRVKDPSALHLLTSKRDYKAIKIDSSSKEVKAMKIRVA